MSEVGERIVVVSAPIPLPDLLDFEDAHRKHTGWKDEAIIRNRHA